MEETVIGLEREIAGQGVFVSNFAHSLDPKKRLTIPSVWRAQVGEQKSLYVLPDVDQRCLRVLPGQAMGQRLEKIRQQALSDPKARQAARVLASQSDLVSWDTQGRIRVKDDLLRFAGLTDQVVMVGAFDTFELWNPERLKVAGVELDGIQEALQYVGF